MADPQSIPDITKVMEKYQAAYGVLPSIGSQKLRILLSDAKIPLPAYREWLKHHPRTLCPSRTPSPSKTPSNTRSQPNASPAKTHQTTHQTCSAPTLPAQTLLPTPSPSPMIFRSESSSIANQNITKKLESLNEGLDWLLISAYNYLSTNDEGVRVQETKEAFGSQDPLDIALARVQQFKEKAMALPGILGNAAQTRKRTGSEKYRVSKQRRAYSLRKEALSLESAAKDFCGGTLRSGRRR